MVVDDKDCIISKKARGCMECGHCNNLFHHVDGKRNRGQWCRPVSFADCGGDTTETRQPNVRCVDDWSTAG